MKNAKVRVWVWLVASFAFIGLAVLVSAGTLNYWQAWAYLVVGAASCVPLILRMMQDPVLLESRTKAGPSAEQRPFQRVVVVLAGLPAIASFIVPGLDHRFGWSGVQPWVCLVGELLIIVSMWMVYRVFRANSFGSATVEVSEGQKVISTGPYAIVRNPMYSSAGVYFIGLSLALGSYWGLIPAFLTVLGLVVRLLDEEKFLASDLPGYRDYCATVRWHLVPGVF